MSKQSYFQKAILSELGISSWQLSDVTLLSPEIQSSSAQNYRKQESVPDESITSVYSAQEPSTQQEAPPKTSVDVTGKVVFASKTLAEKLPQWWVKDVLITLDANQHDLLILEDNEIAANAENAKLILIEEQSAASSIESIPSLTYKVTSSLMDSDAKKRLWDVMQNSSKR
ncbi:hypothetical protein [Alteromonas sp. a30]|uniref:hypothetical protein n=1 Tax=Alteromonas sp. a30 TaxID=2730917 RepID=UPI0022829DA5|nr:hypothetical protein [Alteromonas sp. a30]MCY7296657.1 hypothetical protein [Alteromonas sp. a30]